MHNVTRGGNDFLLACEVAIIVCIFISMLNGCYLTSLNSMLKFPRAILMKNVRQWCAFSREDERERERVNSDETIYLFPILDFNRSFFSSPSRTKFCVSFEANSQFQYLDWNYKKFLIINSIICFLVYILFVSFSRSISSIKCQVYGWELKVFPFVDHSRENWKVFTATTANYGGIHSWKLS